MPEARYRRPEAGAVHPAAPRRDSTTRLTPIPPCCP